MAFFRPFLALPSLGVLVSFGLRVRCVLHGLSPLIGYDSLQCQQNTAHADSEKGQDFVFRRFLPLEPSPIVGQIHFPAKIFGDHDGHKSRKQQDQQEDKATL